jgi:hypothetical protein
MQQSRDQLGLVECETQRDEAPEAVAHENDRVNALLPDRVCQDSCMVGVPQPSAACGDIQAGRIDLEQPHAALQASFELREIASDAGSAARDENDGGERGVQVHFRGLIRTVSQRLGSRRRVTKGWPEPDLAPDAHDRE